MVKIRYVTPSLQLLFNPGTVATFNCTWVLITQDLFILTLVSEGLQLDFLTIPPKSIVYQSHLSTIQNARIILRLPLYCPKV